MENTNKNKNIINRTDEQIMNDRVFLNPPVVKEIYFLQAPDINYFDDFSYPCSIKFYATAYNNYLISKCGKIFNLKMNRLVSTSTSTNNYLRVNLNIRGQKRNIFVHRLVAETFLANNENYPIVHHLDNNRRHDQVDNLAWVTFEENNISHRRVSSNKIYSADDKFIETIRNGQDNIIKNAWQAKEIDDQIATKNIDRSNNNFHVAAATKILLDIYDENGKLLYNNISQEECLTILKLPVRYIDYIRADYMTLEYMYMYKSKDKKIHVLWNGKEIIVFLGMKEASAFFSRQANQLYKKINTPREIELLSKKYHIVVRQDPLKEGYKKYMEKLFTTFTDKGKRVIFNTLTLKNILTNS